LLRQPRDLIKFHRAFDFTTVLVGGAHSTLQRRFVNSFFRSLDAMLPSYLPERGAHYTQGNPKINKNSSGQ
jgi:hypothetical protein